MWVMAGDFNAVREEEDRMISRFDNYNASVFNMFIAETGMMEYQMGGYKFTYMPDDGSSLSKINRILVCDEFMNKWPLAKVKALSRYLSNHSPLTLTCSISDFGPIPFKFYNSWLELEGIQGVVDRALEGYGNEECSMKDLAGILKTLKADIKQWRKEAKLKEEKELQEIKTEVEDIEKVAEARRLTIAEKEKRIEGKWKIKKYEKRRLTDLKQKAKMKWAKLGDENSKFIHGIINCRKAKNRINALWINGKRETEPKEIKKAVLESFSGRFKEPNSKRPSLDGRGFRQLTTDQAKKLIEDFSKEEIKEAVWACGSDKAPGA
ncbi:uncharacterized protein LOC110882144 [Helianthus annuus]|uniref:uncharacterized protein LOC110882144 n=1 Tax=Helianthus annuus TaxID=4232 RepID=UPI000B906EB8|nr:uncharacterized protein LOC110882144 [Helianthus annuus]